jgi:hypothetical protein
MLSGGSASGVKATPVGFNRVYVRLNEGEFNYDSFYIEKSVAFRRESHRAETLEHYRQARATYQARLERR